MSIYLIIIGTAIICYTLAAYFFGLPQLSDFLPVGFFSERPEGQFLKVVSTESPDKGPWLVFMLGVAFVLLGLGIKYVSQN
ncbi:hypothetical protein [Bacterioplanoides sp.]|jgi:hypothetical protein|uniref:hypothetical protein n=1 Tax=Bacterioplanoides sp. TaxID=2066072 RepID=UPI003B005415